MDVFGFKKKKIESYCLEQWQESAKLFKEDKITEAGELSLDLLTRFPQDIETPSFNFTQNPSDLQLRSWLPLSDHFMFILACSFISKDNADIYIDILMKLTRETDTPLGSKWTRDDVENRRRDGKPFFKEIHLPGAAKVYQSGLFDAFLLSLNILSTAKRYGINMGQKYHFGIPDGYDVHRAKSGGWHLPDNPVCSKFKIDWDVESITVGSDTNRFDFQSIKSNYSEVIKRLSGLKLNRLQEHYWSQGKESLISKMMKQNNTWI